MKVNNQTSTVVATKPVVTRSIENDCLVLARTFYEAVQTQTYELDSLATHAQMLGKMLGYDDGVRFAQVFLYTLSGME